MVDVVLNSYLFGGIAAHELAEFRRILEPGLAGMAAEKRTDKDLEAMEECISDIQASIDAGTPDQTKAMEFHLLIANACRNKFISSLMEALVTVFQRFLPKHRTWNLRKKTLNTTSGFMKVLKIGIKIELNRSWRNILTPWTR